VPKALENGKTIFTTFGWKQVGWLCVYVCVFRSFVFKTFPLPLALTSFCDWCGDHRCTIPCLPISSFFAFRIWYKPIINCTWLLEL
jgi:hypothetical protein